MSDYVKRLRDARNWFDDGRCCGQLDSAGVCAAPACIFGEALKEFYQAADRIAELEEELSIWQSVFPDIAPERVLPDRRLLLDRIAELEMALRVIKRLALTMHQLSKYRSDYLRIIDAALKGGKDE